jgi:hypothetical protein
MTDKKRGGKRSGAGRPASASTHVIRVPVGITADDVKKLIALKDLVDTYANEYINVLGESVSVAEPVRWERLSRFLDDAYPLFDEETYLERLNRQG